MEDIFDRYDKLNTIFNDENSDVKKAEQSLFLIETNLNNLQKREKQIGERFFEYKDRFLQASNIDALKTLIANFEHSSKYERIAKANFEENSIGSNILLFMNIGSLVKEVELLESKIQFKEALISQMSKIAKSLEEIERSSNRLQKNPPSEDIKIDALLLNKASLDELQNDMNSLNKFLQNLDLADHPTVQMLVNKTKDWNTLYHTNLETHLNKLLKVENKRISINKKQLMNFVTNKEFFSGASSKTIESLSSLISEINKALIELLTSETSLVERSDDNSISVLKEDLFYDSGLDDNQLGYEKLNQLDQNFKTIMNVHRTIFGSIIKSAPTSSLRSSIDKLSEQFEKDIIKTFTDTLFPLIKTQKDEILAKVPEMEAEFGIDSKLLKETIQNYQVIEMLKESEKKLIEWKDDFFLKIQSIQSNSDPKNNESFYRQIINVIKDLSGYLTIYQQITEKDLERKFLNFETTTLKLIILVIKIVDEKKIPKSQQILNLKSSSFVVIQDLIFSLLSLIQEKYNEKYILQ